ncbi:hypothetical protein HS088_TW13G01545 [Tripterygium wilfordii]|uniref:Uncharacterized protein n=1 Tax=Tripterygium wilfordii TaxID=458696 RepID=A0A7J7CX87_TRIWF|nr:hypothetical protein HS088_TW13G01545 [Tripterygium wilfordii]
MKSHFTASSSSSGTTSTTTTAMEERDSCYFPGCRKDANCDCDICLASINATLDLMPISIKKSSLTKFSGPGSCVERTPISFDPSIMSTPRSNTTQNLEPPALKSTARVRFNEKSENRGSNNLGFRAGTRSFLRRLILCFSLILVVEIGFSWMVSGIFRPVLSPEVVTSIGHKSSVTRDLNGRLRFLQNELKILVDGKVSNCSYANSAWKIHQNNLFLNSRCTLYKSAIEEVSVWGWPLQTSGLVPTGFSSRSFTTLSGRVTEKKWSTSVVQLDPNTWVLDYQLSSVMNHNSRLVSAAMELLKYKISSIVEKMKQELWLLSTAFENQYIQFTAKEQVKIPT